MIQTSTLLFLAELDKNNNKDWFEANRNRYEAAREDFREEVALLIRDIGKFDKDIAELEVRNCVFRQNRDVRFSKDKRPYKNNFGAYFNRGGKKINTAGYYLHIEPGKSIVAGGLYDPDAQQLSQVRQEIDYNPDNWKKILKAKAFVKSFPGGLRDANKLTRPPKGYDKDNPTIEYLKLRSFTVATPLTDAELTSPGLHNKLVNSYKSLKPLLDFLNESFQ